MWPITAQMIPSWDFDAELRAHFRCIDGLLDRDRPFIGVLFVTFDATMPAPLRTRTVEWLSSRRTKLSQQLAGTLLISESTMLRFLLSGISLLSPIPNPVHVAQSATEGVPWLRQRAAAAKLKLPSDLEPKLESWQRRFDELLAEKRHRRAS